jgi:hypothetical protein
MLIGLFVNASEAHDAPRWLLGGSSSSSLPRFWADGCGVVKYILALFSYGLIFNIQAAFVYIATKFLEDYTDTICPPREFFLIEGAVRIAAARA